MHTHTCICSCALLWVRMPLLFSVLSPAASVPPPEREEMHLDAHYTWAAGPELSCPLGQPASSQASQSQALCWVEWLLGLEWGE